MEKPSDPSLLQEYRSEFAGRFNPLRLWNDRRRILADPAIAAQPQPPLANSPVRFALSLQLLPILFIGWLVGMVSGLIAPDGERANALSGKLIPAIELLEGRLGAMPDAELAEMAGKTSVKDMPAQADGLWMHMVRRMSFRHSMSEPAEVRDVMDDWLQRVQTSDLSEEHRAILEAKALRFLHRLQKNEKYHDKVMRSITEGGVLMQVIGVFTLLFGAWLLGQMLRGDARFSLAARADRFYLYYSTSQVFWLLMVKLLCFGVGSFAYAAGNVRLFSGAQMAQFVVAGITVLWLISRSGEMARVLCNADPAPKGAAFSIAWRMVVAMLVSTIVIVLVAVIVGIALGMVVSMLQD